MCGPLSNPLQWEYIKWHQESGIQQFVLARAVGGGQHLKAVFWPGFYHPRVRTEVLLTQGHLHRGLSRVNLGF
jgi:hypothetical protein